MKYWDRLGDTYNADDSDRPSAEGAEHSAAEVRNFCFLVPTPRRGCRFYVEEFDPIRSEWWHIFLRKVIIVCLTSP